MGIHDTITSFKIIRRRARTQASISITTSPPRASAFATASLIPAMSIYFFCVFGVVRFTKIKKFKTMTTKTTTTTATEKRKITTLKTRLKVKDQQKSQCAICGQMLGFRYHIDHKQALCLGGQNVFSNLQALCLICHDNKTFLEIMLFHQQKYGRCMWCNQKLFSLQDHVCETKNINKQEQKWEEKTLQSKYFVPHTFSFHKIQYPSMIDTPSLHFQKVFSSVFEHADVFLA